MISIEIPDGNLPIIKGVWGTTWNDWAAKYHGFVTNDTIDVGPEGNKVPYIRTVINFNNDEDATAFRLKYGI